MIAISDASPLTALLTVGQASFLPPLFQEGLIPVAVRHERLNNHPHHPQGLRLVTVRDTLQASKYLQLVDAGDAEAIELAHPLNASLLLMDERKSRKLAAQEGVAVIGLLGVVLLAKWRRSGWRGRV